MKPLNIKDVIEFVEKNIGTFHSKRIVSLEKLSLSKILKQKNPYLFKAKNILTSQDLIKTILDAHLSSQEEAIFGDFLEGLALFINQKVFNGQKSSAEGIDLEFNNSRNKYIVSIKSGPNWGNSSQVKKMKDNFNKAKRILRTSNSKISVIAVNGCCYGRDHNPDKGDYFKYCGEKFWYFISGHENLFIDIIEPLGYKAKLRNEEFLSSYSQIINNFTLEFGTRFCPNGKINWEKLVKFNSSSDAIKI